MHAGRPLSHSPDRSRSDDPAPAPPGTVAALPRIVALVLDRRDRARLLDAVKGRAMLELVTTGEALEGTTLTHLSTVISVIAEPVDGARRPTAPVLARLRTQCPGLAIVGYCQSGHAHSAEILALALAGVHDLLFRGDEANAVAVLARGSHASAASEVLEALRDVLDDTAWRLVERCIHRVKPGFKARDMARVLGVSNKTLVQRCRVAGLPMPGALLAWLQLMIVGYLLEMPARSVEQIALSLEFNSPTALRNMLKRYTGLRPLEVRDRGGLACLIEEFQKPDAFGRHGRGDPSA